MSLLITGNGDSANVRRVKRAYDVCSSDYYLGCELQHLKKVFHKQNDYPNWVIYKLNKQF